MNKKTELSKTLSIIERKDGFWLWDDTRRMNLSMRAKTAQDAFVECITYYQNRLSKVETELRELQSNVDVFIGQFNRDEDDDL